MKAPYEIDCRKNLFSKELVFLVDGKNVVDRLPSGLEGLLSMREFVYYFSEGADEVIVKDHVYRKQSDQVEGDHRLLLYKKV